MTTNMDSGKYTPRTIEVKLPSRGVTYGPDFPDSIVVGAFSWAAHAHLNSNQEGIKKMLALLTSGIIKNFPPNFNYKNMLLADAMFVFALARSLTFGEVYKFKTLCPACEAITVAEVKVPDNLPVKVWNYASMAEVVKASTLSLPECKDRVTFGYSTMGTDMNRRPMLTGLIEAIKKEEGPITKLSQDELSYLLGYAFRVTEVNGDHTDTTQLEAVITVLNYMLRLDGPDVEYMKSSMEEKECGIAYEVDMQCDKCTATYKADMPLGLDFFRRNQV